jgi:hypothetical protein
MECQQEVMIIAKEWLKIEYVIKLKKNNDDLDDYDNAETDDVTFQSDEKSSSNVENHSTHFHPAQERSGIHKVEGA